MKNSEAQAHASQEQQAESPKRWQQPLGRQYDSFSAALMQERMKYQNQASAGDSSKKNEAPKQEPAVLPSLHEIKEESFINQSNEEVGKPNVVKQPQKLIPEKGEAQRKSLPHKA